MDIFRYRCSQCDQLVELGKRGRPREYCSNACRQRAYRNRGNLKPTRGDVLPEALRSRARWILHKAKRPIALGGWWASVKDATTWLTYGEARDAVKRGDVYADGYGFVLNGDGVTCLDLDDCVEGGEPNVFARDFVRALEVDGPLYVEFSPSGRGLHVWGFSDMPKGRVIAGGNLKVEVYPNKRFITVTGKPYREGELKRLHIHNALRLVA